jgi:hypothetical protein
MFQTLRGRLTGLSEGRSHARSLDVEHAHGFEDEPARGLPRALTGDCLLLSTMSGSLPGRARRVGEGYPLKFALRRGTPGGHRGRSQRGRSRTSRGRRATGTASTVPVVARAEAIPPARLRELLRSKLEAVLDLDVVAEKARRWEAERARIDALLALLERS